MHGCCDKKLGCRRNYNESEWVNAVSRNCWSERVSERGDRGGIVKFF